MLIWARQIKAARSLIGWEQYQLAAKAGVGIATIRRLERMSGPINAHFDTIERIRRALEQAGIEQGQSGRFGAAIAERAFICNRTAISRVTQDSCVRENACFVPS